MKSLFTFQRICVLFVLSLFCFAAIQAQTTAFTYQGKLSDTMASGNVYDFQFNIYSTPTGGSPLNALPVTIDDKTLINGTFAVQLDFGSTVFPGADRYLEIGVRRGSETGAFTILNPRQQIGSTPYAIQSLTATSVSGSVSAAQISGTVQSANLPSNLAKTDVNNIFTGDNTVNNLIISSNKNLTLSGGQIIAPRVENLTADPAASAGRIYFNTATGKLRVSDGTSWSDVGARNIVALVGSPSSSTALNSGQTIPGRTVQITKASASSKLRVTYNEWFQASPAQTSQGYIQITMDGFTNYPPGPISGVVFPYTSTNFQYGSAIVVGYITNVPAGVHIIGVKVNGQNFSTFGGSQYTLEVEEVP